MSSKNIKNKSEKFIQDTDLMKDQLIDNLKKKIDESS